MLSPGDSLDNWITLMASKTKVWTIPAGSSVAGIAFSGGGSPEVLTLKGNQYRAHKFDPETGLFKGKVTTLKIAHVDSREYYYGVNLTGDGAVSLIGQEQIPTGWIV